MKNKFNKIKALAGGALLLSVLSIAVVNAENNIPGRGGERERNENHSQNIIKDNLAINATVTAINGNILTVSVLGKNSTSSTTYTVDVSNAFIIKSGSSGIMVNDKIIIKGTINGTTIVAKIIYDGPSLIKAEKEGKSLDGIVTAINGNTLTISQNIRNKDNSSTTKIYTVDTSHALIIKQGATSSISGIAINDKIMVNGTIDGTTITAKIIHDGVGQKNWNKDGEKHDKDLENKPEKSQAKFFDKFKNFFKNFLKKDK